MKRLLSALTAGALIGLLGMYLLSIGYFSTWNSKLTSFLYPTGQAHTGLVTIVAIDKASLQPQEEGGLGRWQNWKRGYYAQVIRNLRAGGARVIGVDVFFSEPSSEGLLQELTTFVEDMDVVVPDEDVVRFAKQQDHALKEALAEKDDVVLAAQTSMDGNGLWPHEDIYTGDNATLASVEIQESENNLARTVQVEFQDYGIRSFSLELVRKFLGLAPEDITIADGKLHILKQVQKDPYTGKNLGPITLPLQSNGAMMVNFKGTPYTTPTLSFVDVYNNNFAKEMVEHRIILIGEMDAGLHDEVYTPVSFGIAMPGVEFHANAIETMLTSSAPSRLAGWIQGLGVVLMAILAAALFYHVRPWVAGVCTLLFFPCYFFVAVMVFARFQLFINIIHPPLVIVLTLITVLAIKYLFIEREKKHAITAFSHYVSDKLVAKVVEDPEHLELGGEKRQMVVTFTDLAGFTTLSESVEPEVLVDFLHDYLGTMTDIVMEGEGTLDKYIGDAIMCFWGAPAHIEDGERKACQTILKMHEAVEEVKARWSHHEAFADIHIRTGLAYGDMVVGNFGSSKRFDYTVIGDTVNLAARLEGANKAYGTFVSVNEALYLKTKAHCTYRILDLIQVKGKVQPVKMYELIAEKSRTAIATQELITQFEEAFECYLEKQFKDARARFEELVRRYDDPVSKVYAARCLAFIQNPPGANWDGVFQMKTK